MADSKENKTTKPSGGSSEHRKKEMSIMDYSKMSQKQYGYSTNFKNVAKENIETPKTVTIGRILIGLSAILLIWATYQPFTKIMGLIDETQFIEAHRYIDGDGIIVVFLALIACIMMVFRNARKYTVISGVLSLAVVILDASQMPKLIGQVSQNEKKQIMEIISAKFGLGFYMLILGAAIMIAGAVMILVTDLKRKKK